MGGEYYLGELQVEEVENEIALTPWRRNHFKGRRPESQ